MTTKADTVGEAAADAVKRHRQVRQLLSTKLKRRFTVHCMHSMQANSIDPELHHREPGWWHNFMR